VKEAVCGVIFSAPYLEKQIELIKVAFPFPVQKKRKMKGK
jgi:hypothetical protein